MSLNQTPSSGRVHIGLFGRRNAGKSSLINAITNQNIALVSDVLGTTTDPVYKAMELLPLGPVMIIDTPGLDDEGELGLLRIKKANQVINKTDIALVVIDSQRGKTPLEEDLIIKLDSKKIPYITVFNKSDLADFKTGENEIAVSSVTGKNIDALKEMIAKKAVKPLAEFPILSDLIQKGDFVILVTPIDESAPKGRIILPQQQTIREILDSNAISVVCQVNELEGVLGNLKTSSRMVITDSQAFGSVSKIVPENIPLTSFSILMARHKGELFHQLEGAKALDSIKDNDKILISEGCTHHRQCGDIGTVKLPAFIRNYTKANPEFDFTSGTEFPEDLSPYKLVIHCGGCMQSEREMKYRIQTAKDQNIPITNYGMIIAKTTGILDRSMKVFI
ncbi:MAG: [FeFe] hydrogenase H-cluster maturation GTPase HydF [Ruminococcaceae bacterium]|nr:[FeFe] hydrogenase H-cluster maturation GTPase HydF [Oscillospiraceae bacterium]